MQTESSDQKKFSALFSVSWLLHTPYLLHFACLYTSTTPTSSSFHHLTNWRLVHMVCSGHCPSSVTDPRVVVPLWPYCCGNGYSVSPTLLILTTGTSVQCPTWGCLLCPHLMLMDLALEVWSRLARPYCLRGKKCWPYMVPVQVTWSYGVLHLVLLQGTLPTQCSVAIFTVNWMSVHEWSALNIVKDGCGSKQRGCES